MDPQLRAYLEMGVVLWSILGVIAFFLSRS